MNRVFFGVLKYTTPVPCRGVACYARTSAQRAAHGVRRGAACYALRRKAHKKAMVFFSALVYGIFSEKYLAHRARGRSMLRPYRKGSRWIEE